MPRTKNPARDSLAPQLRAYSKMGRDTRWLPFLMFLQGSNVRSDVVNTDRFGFRWTILPDGTVSSVESPPPGPCSLLVGSSTTFGVGATSDATTLASVLSASTGRPWINFSARAHCSTQELLTFMMYADVLPPIRQIVFMSGVNDLYMQYAANRFDDHLGAFFYSDRYFAAMEQVRGQSIRKRLGAALKRITEKDPALPFETVLAQREGRRDRVLALVRRNLSHWAVFASNYSATVLFALQPVFPWLGKKASPEEQELFSARESRDPRNELMIGTALSAENHEWYATSVKKICEDLGLGFVDLNVELRRETEEDEWLFVDRVHFNDRGYAACAESLAKLVE